MSVPVYFSWDGEAMVPLPRFARVADRQFTIGERYRLEVIEERSRATHNHFFAFVHEAWMNLPEAYEGHFPTADHLRKWALIKAGFRNERSIVTSSKAEAQRIAAFIRPMDDFAVITVSEAVVTVYTARSQAVRAMGKKVFQQSKEAVLDVLAKMIGVDPSTLSRAAGPKPGDTLVKSPARRLREELASQ